ncbi:MAG: 2-hydroxyacid dehydrogenase [Burkholderiaceae bacterium]|nr:2-hydroxyacid dehydrogenase [Burkholderiaceae bacterium]MDP1968959.1 2-hydroxyacid dehydrogenase [Burkholderiaceae bacterium]
MSYTVACLDVFAPSVCGVIEASAPAGFKLVFARTYERDEQLALARDADFLLVGTAPVNADMIGALSRCRLIQKWGMGLDRIDLEAARKSGIPVAFTYGDNAGPVAEHAVMLMLAVNRRLPYADRKLREGVWLKTEMRGICYQLAGKTVGLIGFGNIARMVAQFLKGFAAEVIYYDIRRADRVAEKSLNATYVSLDELLARSDIVSLHTPLNAATKDLVRAETIARMKDGAIIINTARGGVIHEPSLYEALVSGKLRGAGLDTFVGEPPSRDNPLLSLDQVVVTPHSGGGVFDNVETVARHAFSNMELRLAGDPLPAADLAVWPETLAVR